MKKSKSILRLDPLSTGVLIAMVIGLLLPFADNVLAVLKNLQLVGIFMLFWVYGARLPTTEVLGGLLNWRLQGSIITTTFILFPLFGFLTVTLLSHTTPLSAAILAGVLYVTVLPSTIQSALALTSVAKGNVPGALCAATVSNVLGMVLSPLLTILLVFPFLPNMEAVGSGNPSLEGMMTVFKLLLLPFIIGQLMQPKIGEFMREKTDITK